MAVPPKFSGQVLSFTNSSSTESTPHTLELYLDYVCPFSDKIFKTFYHQVIPTIESKYSSSSSPGIKIIFRQQIQPWHPSSTLVHEAGAAVLRLSPSQFWQFSDVLFQHQKDYFDVNVVNESRNVTYKKLAKLVEENFAGKIDADEFLELLHVNDVPGGDDGSSLNTGNGVTDDVKVMVKMNRLTGVHVTPTVVFNGVVENAISSSWDQGQWEEWLEKNVK